MNWLEFNNIFNNSEILGEKIVIKSQLVKSLDFIKNNYGFNILKEIIAIDNGDGSTELIYKLYSVEDDETSDSSIMIRTIVLFH